MLSDECLYPHLSLWKHLFLPQLLPAFRRVAEHVYAMRILAGTQTFLWQSTVRTEDEGSWFRRQQRRDQLGKLKLLLLRE